MGEAEPGRRVEEEKDVYEWLIRDHVMAFNVRKKHCILECQSSTKTA